MCASPATANGRRWLRDDVRSRLNTGKRERHMAQYPFFQDILTTIANSHEASARTQCEIRETIAAVREALVKARELMAKIDAVIAMR